LKWPSGVARTEVDLEFRDATVQVPVLARIPGDQPLDPNEDPGSTGGVLERVDPAGVLVSLVYTHRSSVAQRLLLSRLHDERGLT
jgi:hypothetical protein